MNQWSLFCTRLAGFTYCYRTLIVLFERSQMVSTISIWCLQFYFVFTQLNVFSLRNQLTVFYLTHRWELTGSVTLCLSGPGSHAKKGYSTFSKAQRLRLHHQLFYCHIQDTRRWHILQLQLIGPKMWGMLE